MTATRISNANVGGYKKRYFYERPSRITRGVSFLASERHKSLGLNTLPRRKVGINDLESQPLTASFLRYGGGGTVVAVFLVRLLRYFTPIRQVFLRKVFLELLPLCAANCGDKTMYVGSKLKVDKKIYKTQLKQVGDLK